MKKINTSNIESVVMNRRTISIIAKIDGRWFLRGSADIGLPKEEIFTRVDGVRAKLEEDFFILVPRDFLTNSATEWIGKSLFFVKEDFKGYKNLVQEILNEEDFSFAPETEVYRHWHYCVNYGRIRGEAFCLKGINTDYFVGFDDAEPESLDVAYVQKGWYLLGSRGKTCCGGEPIQRFIKRDEEGYPIPIDQLVLENIVREKLARQLFIGKGWIDGSPCSDRGYNGLNHYEYYYLKEFDKSWDLILGRV